MRVVYIILLQCQEINNKGCMHEILWCFKAFVLGDRFIWYRPLCHFITDVRGLKLQVWGHAGQCSSLPNCICQQKSVQCRAVVQQHWEGTLDILHRLIRFHHYCFAKEVYAITDHKPLIAMISRHVAAAHHAAYTQVQCAYLILTWSQTVHSGLAIMLQPWRKLWPRNTRYACEYT